MSYRHNFLVFYVMGKALSGKLSCMGTDLVMFFVKILCDCKFEFKLLFP